MINHSVIPAAGFGTRMLPIAKAIPKEMLPILDKPTIQYVIEEAAAANISDILLITSKDKRAIEDHFDQNPELDARLVASNRQALLADLTTLIAKIKIHATRQPGQNGLGHAVLQAKSHVGANPFLCQLGDTIFSAPPGVPLPAQQLIQAYTDLKTPIIALEKVPLEKVDRYGIAGGAFISPDIMKLNTLIEKPSKESAPSQYAICARYILTPQIFPCLEQTKPGKSNEIQLTDALQLLLKTTPVHGVILKATRHDIGNPADWLKTNLIYAAQDPQLWPALQPLLKSLLNYAPPPPQGTAKP